MALFGVITWSLFVDALRLISICAFLACSLTFNIYSFAALISVLSELDMLQYRFINHGIMLDSLSPFEASKGASICLVLKLNMF